MSILEDIKKARKEAILNKNETIKSATRMILGEVPRLNKLANELPTDDEMIAVIKSLIKGELITLNYSGQDTSLYLEALKLFLPQLTPEIDIIEFLQTIDFSKLKNKMQAISIVKEKFGVNLIDSQLVKKIIERDF